MIEQIRESISRLSAPLTQGKELLSLRSFKQYDTIPALTATYLWGRLEVESGLKPNKTLQIPEIK